MSNTIDAELISKLFVKFSILYGSVWANRHKTDEEWAECNATWLKELRGFEYKHLILAAKESFSTYKDFPPTLPQLVFLCLKHSGVPTVHEALRLAIKKDFTHPIVSELYSRIGSWALKNATMKELSQSAMDVYPDILSSYRSNPIAFKGNHQMIESNGFSESNPKMLTAEERAKFKSAFGEQKEKLEKMEPMVHPTWEANKVNIYHNDYDANVANVREKYLTSLNEYEATTLPPMDYYDRSRFLMAKESEKHLKRLNNGSVPSYQKGNVHNIDAKRKYGAPSKVYKTWMND